MTTMKRQRLLQKKDCDSSRLLLLSFAQEMVEFLIKMMLRGLSDETLIVYLYDINIVERKFEKIKENSEGARKIWKISNLKLNPSWSYLVSSRCPLAPKFS